jgi:predicted Zn-ribbon and HTH transcriptional regulator
MVKVIVNTAVCKKCGWIWIPRKAEIKICPNCKNKHWDKPRKVKPVADESQK